MALSRQEFSHSSCLFEGPEGNSLAFHLRPSATRSRLQALIEHGGGSVTGRPNPSKEYIRLLAEGDKAYTAGCIKASYIDDCIAQNLLLDMEMYRVKPEDVADDKNDNAGGNTSTSSIVSTTTSIKGRSKFTAEDDDAILSYIARNPDKYGGNVKWKKMEFIRVTNHSWSSMKDRFNKRLLHRLPDYIRKYKSGVLDKYGFTSASASSSDKEENGPETKEKENLVPKNQNNNSDQPKTDDAMDIDSNDSFDNSLMEMIEGTSKQAVPSARLKRAADLEKRNTVEKSENNIPSSKDDHEKATQDEQMLSGMTVARRSPRKLQPKKIRYTPTNKQDGSDSEVQRSHQADDKDTDTAATRLKSVAPPGKSPGKHYSSQDAEGEDTEDYSQSPRILRRKTRQTGQSLRKRKSKGAAPKELNSSSSGSEDKGTMKQSSPKIPRFDQVAIDDIIDKEEEDQNGQNGEEIQDSDAAESQSLFSQDLVGQQIIGKETMAEAEAIIKRIMAEFGISIAAARYVVYINSGNIDSAYHYLRTGKPLTGCFLWLKEHDDKLNSSNTKDLQYLIRKYGEEEVSARQNYLDV